MVRAALVLLALSAQPAASAEKAIGLAAWAAALPPSFTAHGTKTEPTYEATVEIARVGDVVSATGRRARMGSPRNGGRRGSPRLARCVSVSSHASMHPRHLGSWRPPR